MKGQKLSAINTYQIEHYNTLLGSRMIIVLGWTSQVKLFTIQTDKNGYFNKLEKGPHLPHHHHPKCSTIDPTDIFALSISKNDQIFLWNLLNIPVSIEKAIQGSQLGLENIHACLVHTLIAQNQRIKTLIVFADSFKVVITNRKMEIIQKIEGIKVKEMFMMGNMNNLILGTLNQLGKMIIWDCTSILKGIEETVQERHRF